jgi:sarcosine oxidase subunit gamma
VTASLLEVVYDAQVSVRGAPQPGFPTEPNTTAEAGGRLVLWLGPDEWLVLGGREEEYPDAAAAVDVSANRVAFELSGSGAAHVLARG